MNIVKKIGIASVGPFKTATTLPIVPGISFLYGKNNLSGGNANAVGKSLLAGSVSDVFYEPAIRQDKPACGTRLVEFTKDGKNIRIVSKAGKTGNTRIFIDGKDKTPRTATAAKAMALKLWGLSDDEYLTYGCVDYATAHPLVKGNTASRKTFFSSFFGLNQMDAEKKIFMKELAEVKKAVAAHAELEKAFQSVRADMLSKSEREDLEAKALELRKKVKVLKKEQTLAQYSQRMQTFYDLAKDKIKKLHKVKRTVKEIERDLRKISQYEEQLHEYEYYRHDLAKYNEAKKGIDLSVSLDDLEPKSREYLECLSVTKRELYKPERPERPVKPQGDLGEAEAKVRACQHELTHARKFKTGVCGTCGQPVKARDPRRIEKELNDAMDVVNAWNDYMELADEWKEYTRQIAKYKELKAEQDEAATRLPKLKKSHDTYLAMAALPPKPQKVEEPECNLPSRERLLEELELTKFAESNEDNIKALENWEPIEFDNEELNVAQEKVYEIEAKLQLHEKTKTRAIEIRERLAELRVQVKKKEALELILQGYADKAMKRMAIEAISQYLMESVNRYASLVFENYKFEFIWGTQIQILVHRPEGTSDVRKLSGAESMLFTLILILSLLTFVPSSKRLNLLILDEPYAAFSATTADMFTELLPHINQVIPSILIVTPKSGFRVAGAREFTVVKDKGGSKVVKGHPDEI